MKVKAKTAVKTVAATKKACAKKCACAAKKTTEKSVTFTVRAESGKTVYLAGCFNNWNPTGKKMTEKKGTGVYSAAIKLAPGRYEYKFVVDGVWCADPECADWVKNEHGTLNSVIEVR